MLVHLATHCTRRLLCHGLGDGGMRDLGIKIPPPRVGGNSLVFSFYPRFPQLASESRQFASRRLLLLECLLLAIGRPETRVLLDQQAKYALICRTEIVLHLNLPPSSLLPRVLTMVTCHTIQMIQGGLSRQSSLYWAFFVFPSFSTVSSGLQKKASNSTKG